MSRFEIRYDDAHLRDELIIRLDNPILYARDQEVSEVRVPLRELGYRSDLEELKLEVLRHEVRHSKLGPLTAAPPSPPSSDYVRLLEERLARADVLVERLLAALVDPA